MKNWNYIEGAKVGNADNWRSYDEMIKKAKHDLEVIKQKEREAASFSKKQELASARREIEDKLKYYQKQTGNELPWGSGINIPKTKGNYTFPDPKEIEKKIQEAIKRGESPAFIEGMKDVLKRAKEERNKRTGNDTPWEYAHRKPKVINDDKTGAEEFFKQLSDDVKEREKKDDADIEKVGNFKTGTSQLKPGDKVMSFGKKGTVKEVIGENTDNIYGEPLIKVEFEDGTTKTIGEHYMRKVGNARYTTREDVISHLDTDLYDICKKVPAGSPSFAYVSELQKKGWDISTISKYTKEIGKIIDQYKVGNKEYSTDDFKRIKEEALRIAQTTKDEEKKKRALKIADYMKYAHNQPDWGKIVDRYDQELKQIGNSASDDKFAYVMREFDEGKLKTPDGKVVTDPAQAKAIAYSESKKTENGLARARRAMAGNGLLDTVLSKTKHIKRFGIGSKVQAEGETGTVVKETVEVGPNGIPFGWVTVKFSDGKTRQYYDYDLKK